MRYLLSFLIFFSLSVLPASAATIVPVSAIQPGELIRGQSYSAVYYYGRDGFRYVFPNDKTYSTWYKNFDGVKWISDADMATIQIGGNVTYKPGVKMVKINSSPTVYAVAENGALRAIASEQIASSLYGSSWNKKIDDIPDGFFSNYSIGSPIDLASQYDPSAEQDDAVDINLDKNLRAFVTINITDTGYNPSTKTIEKETAVRFVNQSSTKHSATEWDGRWGTGTLDPGDHFTRYFRAEDVGRWSYYSKYASKSTMQGTLFVE